MDPAPPHRLLIITIAITITIIVVESLPVDLLRTIFFSMQRARSRRVGRASGRASDRARTRFNPMGPAPAGPAPRAIRMRLRRRPGPCSCGHGADPLPRRLANATVTRAPWAGTWRRRSRFASSPGPTIGWPRADGRDSDRGPGHCRVSADSVRIGRDFCSVVLGLKMVFSFIS